MATGSVNRAIIIGNVGKDPVIRYSPSGFCIASFSIATSEVRRNNQTNQNEESTFWHNIVAFGKLAEFVEKYVKRGNKVYVDGSIRMRKWKSKDTSQDRFRTEISAISLQILSSKYETEKNQDSFKSNEDENLDDSEWSSDDVPF